jgi:hypothetical protein
MEPRMRIRRLQRSWFLYGAIIAGIVMDLLRLFLWALHRSIRFHPN